jgi:hypothetical protein
MPRDGALLMEPGREREGKDGQAMDTGGLNTCYEQASEIYEALVTVYAVCHRSLLLHNALHDAAPFSPRGCHW